MAKKKEISEEIKFLKIKVQENKVVFGVDRVLKNLNKNKNKINKIFLANNCPVQVKGDIIRYAKLAEVSVVELDQSNEELGVICKKNFFVSALGIIEE